MIAINLSKQQTLDADPEWIKQINFTGNLAREIQIQQCFPLLKKWKKIF